MSDFGEGNESEERSKEKFALQNQARRLVTDLIADNVVELSNVFDYTAEPTDYREAHGQSHKVPESDPDESLSLIATMGEGVDTRVVAINARWSGFDGKDGSIVLRTFVPSADEKGIPLMSGELYSNDWLAEVLFERRKQGVDEPLAVGWNKGEGIESWQFSREGLLNAAELNPLLNTTSKDRSKGEVTVQHVDFNNTSRSQYR